MTLTLKRIDWGYISSFWRYVIWALPRARLVEILLSSNTVSRCKYARLHSMKLGSRYKTISDYLWACVMATRKSKIPSLPLRQGFSTSVAPCRWGWPRHCRTLSRILWPPSTRRQYQAPLTHPPTHKHTLVTTKYVSRCCQMSPRGKIPPLL